MSNSIYQLSDSMPGNGRAASNCGTEPQNYHAHSAEEDSTQEYGETLSIALISPNGAYRDVVADTLRACSGIHVREIPAYPPSLTDLPRLLDQQGAVLIDLDSDPEYALRMVEHISAKLTLTIMVFSAEAAPDKLMRSMRAGAREFLTLPVEQGVMEQAVVRALTRRPANPAVPKAEGSLLTFIGAKGGVGVTTLACNFALALAEQRDRSTLLIDLAVPLGDVALDLGIQSEYSCVNALHAADRLDTSFLSKLVVKHSSGLSVLGAPGRFVPYEFTTDTVGKLLSVARQSFDYVVVDAGSRLDLTEVSLFKDASTIYLVAQLGIAELRNSNRLISQSFAAATPKVEIVLNRYDPRGVTLPEDYIAKVLTKPPRWKIPNDYASVQRMQTDAISLVPGDTPISRAIQEMARAVTGQPAPVKKKKAFSFFG